MASVHHVINTDVFNKLLRSTNGAVAQDILRRCLKVESAARRNLGSNPKRVDTGRLRASITHQFIQRSGGLGAIAGRVGTNVKYARFVHDGTGIYGPRHALIRPVNGKALRWPAKAKRGKGKSKGGFIYSKTSKGMAPNKFLKDALKAGAR
jgi:hypothetical protein